MKKNLKKKKVPALPPDATEREVIQWATRHDPLDRIAAGISEVIGDHSDLEELLESAILEENTAQLNMRIPVAMKFVLMRLARERTTDATTLGRIWLAERIRQELKHKGSAM